MCYLLIRRDWLILLDAFMIPQAICCHWHGNYEYNESHWKMIHIYRMPGNQSQAQSVYRSSFKDIHRTTLYKTRTQRQV